MAELKIVLLVLQIFLVVMGGLNIVLSIASLLADNDKDVAYYYLFWGFLETALSFFPGLLLAVL